MIFFFKIQRDALTLLSMHWPSKKDFFSFNCIRSFWLLLRLLLVPTAQFGIGFCHNWMVHHMENIHIVGFKMIHSPRFWYYVYFSFLFSILPRFLLAGLWNSEHRILNSKLTNVSKNRTHNLTISKSSLICFKFGQLCIFFSDQTTSWKISFTLEKCKSHY